MNLTYNNYAIRENCIVLGTEDQCQYVAQKQQPSTIFFDKFFYTLNCALGWPRKIIFFDRVTQLVGIPDALSILLETISDQPWVEGQRPAIEPNMDVVIVFDGRGEGLPKESVHNAVEFAKLHPTIPCYYLSGAEPVPITFEYWDELKGDITNLKLITQNSFETCNFDEAYHNYEHDFKVTKTKKFHYFVGKPRMHRYMLLALLAERKVLDQGILSYGWGGDPQTAIETLDVMKSNKSEEYMSHFPNLLKVCQRYLPRISPVECPYSVVDSDNMANISRYMDRHDKYIYDNTWFHVSTETSNLTSTRLKDGWMLPSTIPLFYTEKTYRPMLLKQVGITCGQQGHLQGLKNKDYKPFGMWNNSEQTDMIYNDEERLIAQADAILDMCNWPDTLFKDRAMDYANNDGLGNKNKIINSSINLMVHPH